MKTLLFITISLFLGILFFAVVLPFIEYHWGQTVIDFGLGLLISFVVGWVAFDIICPKKKRDRAANRITVVLALMAYSICMLTAFFTSPPKFSLGQFLLEGVLVGAIIMGIIYGIAQAIHWAIRGKLM
ncbi:hypothetical protein ACFLTL_00910 [Chloroflexota bacterium]